VEFRRHFRRLRDPLTRGPFAGRVTNGTATRVGVFRDQSATGQTDSAFLWRRDSYEEARRSTEKSAEERCISDSPGASGNAV